MRLNLAIVLMFVAVLLRISALGQESAQSQPDELEAEARRSVALWTYADYDRAIENYTKASELRDARGEFALAADDLVEAGRIASRLEDRIRREAVLEKALKYAVSKGLTDQRIRVLAQIVLMRINRQDIVGARGMIAAARRLQTAATSVQARGELLLAEGETDYYAGTFDRAEGPYLAAIELFSQSGAKESEAHATLSLGQSYDTTENYGTSFRYLNRARDLFTEIGDRRGLTLVSVALGSVLVHFNGRQAALGSCEAAERQFPENLDPIWRAVLYATEAYVYSLFGESQTAIAYQTRALEIFDRERMPFGVHGSTLLMGGYYLRLGRPVEAIDWFRKAVIQADELKAEYTRGTARAQLATAELANGNLIASERLFAVAIPLLEKTRGLRWIAQARSSLATIKMKHGDLRAARHNLDQSLAIVRKTKDEFAESAILLQMARLELVENGPEAALTPARRSVEITDQMVNDVLSDKLRTSFISNIYERYEFLIEVLMQLHEEDPSRGYDREALRVSEESRARVFREQLALSISGQRGGSDSLHVRERELRATISTFLDKISDLRATDGSPETIDRLERTISDRRLELESVTAEIKRENPLLSAIREPGPFDVDRFRQQILDDRTAVLEFMVGEKSGYLWVITKDAVSSMRIPARAEIGPLVSRFRKAVADYPLLPTDSIESYNMRTLAARAEIADVSDEIGRLFLEPARDLIANKRLVVIPDGPLHFYPLGAATSPNSAERKPLVDTHEIVYERSASSLQSLSEIVRPADPGLKDILLISDPVFEPDDRRFETQTSDENGNSRNSLRRLVGTERERKTVREALNVPDEDDLSGFHATRDGFFSANPSRFRILHFATHGVVDEANPDRSGIALTGFDRDRNQIESTLRLGDIQGIRLNADLVVLSACETSTGNDFRGEGIESLAGAFEAAGARTVVSSLWPVEDNATKKLMEIFYRNLMDGRMTVSEAMREAKVKLRADKQFESPYYWAGFTVQGEIDVKPSLRRSNRYNYLFPLAVPIAAIFLAYVYRLKRRTIRP